MLLAAQAESQGLLAAVAEAAKGGAFETLILCGGSKGGANALAAAIQWPGPLERGSAPLATIFSDRAI